MPRTATEPITLRSGVFTRYFLSAFVFKSVLIGGGYATGRELVEFFLTCGPTSGLLGIAVADPL